MKKIWLVLLIMLTAVGCGTTKDDDNKDGNKDNDVATYTDGTYEAIAKGYGGDFTVKVTISDDKITEITTANNNETPSIGQAAITSLTDEMIADQSADDVDIVAGATVTSNAFIQAVKDCMTSAKK